MTSPSRTAAVSVAQARVEARSRDLASHVAAAAAERTPAPVDVEATLSKAGVGLSAKQVRAFESVSRRLVRSPEARRDIDVSVWFAGTLPRIVLFDSRGLRQEFAAGAPRPEVVHRFVDALRDLVVAHGVAPDGWIGVRVHDPRVLPAGARLVAPVLPWPHERRSWEPLRVAPCRLGALPGASSGFADFVPPGTKCETTALLDALGGTDRAMRLQHGRSAIALARRTVGSLDVTSGLLSVVEDPGPAPMGDRCTFVEVPNGEHAVEFLRAAKRGATDVEDPVALIVRTGDGTAASWALAGRAGARPRAGAWRRVVHGPELVAVGDLDFAAMWDRAMREATHAELTRLTDGLENRLESGRVASWRIPSPVTRRAIVAWATPMGAPIYVARAASGAVVAVVVMLDQVTGSLH